MPTFLVLDNINLVQMYFSSLPWKGFGRFLELSKVRGLSVGKNLAAFEYKIAKEKCKKSPEIAKNHKNHFVNCKSRKILYKVVRMVRPSKQGTKVTVVYLSQQWQSHGNEIDLV